jgi:hypothetical protein
MGLLTTLLGAATVAGQAPGDESGPVKAARARQDRIKTIAVEYKRVEVTAAGSVSDGWPLAKPKDPVPAKETTLESVSRLVIDGERFRFEENHPAYSLMDGAIHRRSMVCTCNGSLSEVFFPRGVSGT